MYGNTHHVCGFYYLDPANSQRKYLPQIRLEAHASIISSAYRTTLTQTFANPDGKGSIDEIRYAFPLYDGVSVVDFTCTMGDRVIKGVVKEKQKAREVYQDAVAKGKTAALLERLPDASDVFTTTVGNIPAGAHIKVDIEYLGELKHDAQVDGIRLTIPTKIAPRYGSYPGELLRPDNVTDHGMKITVDAQASPRSKITSIISSSHQVAVLLGRTSAMPSDAELSFQRASATLALNKT